MVSPSLCPSPPKFRLPSAHLLSLPLLPSPPQATGVEAADEVGSSFSQFKLQRAPYNLRYIIYVIKDDKIQIEKEGARGKAGMEGGRKGWRKGGLEDGTLAEEMRRKEMEDYVN